jgi:hypothetical protein
LTSAQAASVAKLAGGKRQNPDKFPANGDPANCPICQEILHAGQFVAPGAPALALPVAAISIAVLVVDIAAPPQRASHAWQSRAPPLL